MVDGLGDSKINHLDFGLTIARRDKDVRGLQVAVDDTILISVRDSLANRFEQLQSFLGWQAIGVALFRQWYASDKFHHEVGPPVFFCNAIEYARNVRMVHECQCLPPSFKSSCNGLGVHSWLDDFQRD